jgi:hypothetical protein
VPSSTPAVPSSAASAPLWDIGAKGEQLLGGLLDPLEAAVGAVVLHDRLIPRQNENIDHIVVASAGVWAVDAKLYEDKLVERASVGTLFQPAVELRVGGRSKMKLVEQSHRQVDALRSFLTDSALDGVPVLGMLCFIKAEWRLFSKPFHIDGVLVAWPKAAVEQLQQPGSLTPERIQQVAEAIAERFPAA